MRVLTGPTGIHLRGAGDQAGAGAGTIFEVQSAGTGDGIYNCYEQTIDATEWPDTVGDDKLDDLNTTSVEVWNMEENDCKYAYLPALALYDRMYAWEMTDDEGNTRWCGVQLSNRVREVRAAESAGSNSILTSSITCNIILNNGIVASVGQLGYNIEVWGRNCGGDVDWDAVTPRIATDDYLFAHNQQGWWWFTNVFMATIDCTCVAP